MDAAFLDLMRQVGEPTEDQLSQRWVAVESIAKGASTSQAAKLVRFAHREPISRAEDEWFWGPFRADDSLFPIDDAVELHARLADACVRWRISAHVGNDAHLVRLANLAGLEPVNSVTLDVARDALIEVPPAAPAMPSTAAFDDAKAASSLEPGVDSATIVASVKAGTAPLIRGMASLSTALTSVVRWSERCMNLLHREQTITHWLIEGARADGTPWTDLPPDVMAVDSGAEMAALLRTAPQAAHERVLSHVVALAGAVDPILPSASPATASEAIDIDTDLLPLVPVHSALERKALDSVGNIAPRLLAVRVMWERTALLTWPTG